MDSDKTREPQYQRAVEIKDGKGLTQLGLLSNQTWHDDPRHLLFVMARYKFVAKLLSGKKRVLEVGCGDAFYNRIVLQEVEQICAVDFDPVLIKDAKDRMESRWTIDYRVHDILSGPVVEGGFDAAYSVDVIEHIPSEDEGHFMSNISRSLDEHGVLIIGTPSVQSQVYASEDSKRGHVNCKDHQQLKDLMLGYFHNAFIFSMNDEVVHTGFYPLAHYLFAVCTDKKPGL
jgi:2-polyprenyl-3-methyl-5-hydroxy-6-metoxy-1,4-benzoquinol methylase